MTFSIIIPLIAILFISSMTWLSYTLGKTKTENARTAAITGFLLSFIPPAVLVYILVLVFKEDVDIV
jgi:hypothetical protein